MISKGNYEYKNTKSIFGIKVIDNKKYFYKKVLLKFLRFFNKHFKDDIEINKYLKYYVCMRVLSPIDITKMDEYDQKIIISLLIYFYENCNSIESLIEIVKK